ncbi:MAG TPA: FAD:protein FMN transferase [Chitinophagaceae bacterium]|nr:FAD:protein FMN transferase [Chitinophagaceae bacterium]
MPAFYPLQGYYFFTSRYTPLLLTALFALLTIAFAPAPALKKIELSGKAQGTTYHITYYAADSVVKKQEVDSILQVIDQSLSLYRPGSLINRFNDTEKRVKPDEHLYKVVKKAIQVHKKTSGLFDITVFPLTAAWGFGPVKQGRLPDTATVQQLLPCVGTELISLKRAELKKLKPCVKLDANGIAQGYSVDVLAGFLQRRNVHHYIAELGGEIRVKGRKPDGKKMSVGIEAPGDDMFFPVIQKIIYPDKGAITTSGNYRNYYESEGRKITHIIDPVSGFPVQSEMVSVTVFAKDAITADAYDNALMLMGMEKAIQFANKERDIAVYIIYRRADGSVADTMSKRFGRLLQP